MEKKPSLFKNKNFTLCFLGAIVSNFASIFYSFSASFYILQISDNNAILQGTFLGMCGVVFLIFDLLGGVFADRFNKVRIMYLTDMIKGLMFIALSLLLLFIDNNIVKIVLLFIMGFFSNGLSGLFTPASSALLPHIVESERLQEAQSYVTVMSTFQSLVGGILAALLFSLVETGLLFCIVGVLYIGSSISEMFIRYEFVKNENKLTVKGVFLDLKEGIDYVVGFKALLGIVIVALFVNFFINPPVNVVLPYFIESDLSNTSYILDNIFEPEMFSSICGVAEGVGMILVGIIIGKKNSDGKLHKHFYVGLSLSASVLMTIAIFYILYSNGIVDINIFLLSFIIGSFLIGFGCGYINIPMSATLGKIISKDKMGKVFSCIDIGCQAFIPFSSFIGGIILQYFGVAALMIFCSVGFILATCSLFFNKKVREI